MKITMYELLGMIKDGKAPKKIKYENREYYLYDNKSYLTTDKTRIFDKVYFSDLNIEIEILEEEKKIPKKLDLILDEQFTNDELQTYIYETQEKVNQVIDYLDYLESKGDE